LVTVAKAATEMGSRSRDGGLVETNICSACDAQAQMKIDLSWLVFM